MKLNFTAILLPIALLSACGNDSPVAKFIVTDKKMVLEEWPDENYIASLDSILAAEPVKKKQEITTNITMNAHKAPIFQLPPQVTGKKDEKGKKNTDKKAANGNSKGPVVSKSPDAGATKANGSAAEDFANRFTNGLAKLQSDPNNAGLYRMVTASDGDDVVKLLRRTYGSGANTLPRFFVISALKSVNPGLNLESLNEGDKVRVPKL